ncbi:UNVERIFIED_CONTAM: ABC transporter G family member 32 [Sesamum radiatum]|uniref:ABC transporter G family member 32 n=1 Tax=Sesamum radiatum TaxID=300843 RepID=A0AAW2KYK4_SESRA
MFSRNALSINGDEEEALVLAALQRSPTYDRARTALFRNVAGELSLVDVRMIKEQEQKQVLDKLVNAVNEDIEGFFRRVRQRFDAVGLEFPKVEVRFQNLQVDALVHVGSRALPTIPNFIFDMTEALLRKLGIFSGRKQKFSILKNINGVIPPSRLTLLLGPPSSGKTTFLLALAGRLAPSLQMSGKVAYNGHNLEEFTPQRTAAYASQQDWHISEMTVREVLEFSGQCQGPGYKHEMLMELLRREKIAGINPDQDLDIFIKAVVLGQQTSFLVEYIMKILGLDICADTLVGDEMLKGISGGQKKRLTTAELLMGPSRVLFLDEISTGLDSSTTHQIIKYLRHTTHALDCTTLVSLLQPDPETYEMFDDIILFSEGQIVYQGPVKLPLSFLYLWVSSVHPEKMLLTFYKRYSFGVQAVEVISEKDQEQYWFLNSQYNYVPVAKFVEAFQSFRVGNSLARELAIPFNKHYNHPAALSTKTYGINRAKLLRISFSWQMLLLKRNSPVFVFKFIQLLMIILIMMSVFFRTTMHHNTLDDGGVYLGALYFAIVMILFNGFMEVPMLIAKLPVLYKHRDFRFYPCWIYTLPSWLLSIPLSLVESFLWVAVTYYAIGFDPQITRCLLQFLIYFALHQMSIGLFRVMASLGRNMVVANTFGSFAMLVVMVLGGFIISRDSIPVWWIWGYWFSPMMYAQNAASVNEFLGHSWDKKAGDNSTLSLGEMLLKVRSLFPGPLVLDWFWSITWIYIVIQHPLHFVLSHLNPLGNQQAIVPVADHHDKDKEQDYEPSIISFGEFLQHSHSFTGLPKNSESSIIAFGEFLQHSHSFTGKSICKRKGMVLPFEPLSMCFSNISYYVDIPLWAGKTTLMDVLAGRKTGGHIEGSIYVSGYPKNQETFARISGYCEQNDVHSPCLTVHESLLFSAWLRLSSQCDFATQRAFVDEVMELVELTPLRRALVGVPGVNGLSVEQRKRLTIAVELVANPSIVFMDEPTSGLDARAAAIVMRAVRNIVDTGRTIVCTIHQPSIDIFESFDEAIPGVQKIRPGYNPAAWILEVTSPAEENRLGLDFAEIYRRSTLFQQNKMLVESLSKPDKDTKALSFPSKYSLSFFGQFLACLWKQNLSYWRNPQYTAGIQQDIFNAMGSMYAAVLFIGITNATSVQPVVFVERFVSYRERAAGMYSELPFAFAQARSQLNSPTFVCSPSFYSAIFYFMASFERNVWKFLWYIYFMYFTLLYFTFFGMMTISVTPNHNVAAILAAPFYMMWNLFSGFMISHMRIPIWWRWYYWANPIAWSLYGLLTSQYGDVDESVGLTDGVHSMPIKQLLKHQFGFRHDFLGIAGLVVVGFCVLFAVTFAFAIKSFNFQRR